MNLVLVRACSNSCPYCFEAGERQRGKVPQITMENVAHVAKWARTSRLRSLSLLGGEPFLHPQLEEFVRFFRKTNPEMSLRILTGGIFNKKLLEKLSPDDTGLVFNINESRDYVNPKHFSKVLNNIEIALQRGFNVILGFNVWRLDFDPEFIPKLAHQFGRPAFSWTVANPQRGLSSNVVYPEMYSQLAGQCISLLQEATRLGVDAMLDCPLPLCFFTDSQLGWLRQFHPSVASSLGACTPVLDVTPELEVIRCFALSNLPRIKLLDFHNEDEISDWFVKNVDHQLLKQGCFPQCSTCPHFIKGRCYGGCLACHSIGFVDGLQPTTQLNLKMQEALANGDPTLALSHFENSGYWAKTDISTFAASVSAFQLNNFNDALRFATDAGNMTEDGVLLQNIRELLGGISMHSLRESPTTINNINPAQYVSVPNHD